MTRKVLIEHCEYELTRAKRKTVSLSISKELKVIVKAPLRMPLKEIEQFVNKHSQWIETHKQIIEQQNAYREKNSLSEAQIEALKSKAKQVLPQRVELYSDIMGVKPSGIKITSAASRWGSCSGKNSLCFSYRLMLLPPEVIDYIVVHELAHIRVKNHSIRFYNEVEKYMPDYRERVAKLKQMQREMPI